MRIYLIFFAFIIPIVVKGQLKGDYAFLFGERSSSLNFEKAHTFRYIPYGKVGFEGEGKYYLNSDTLILTFYSYSDPEVQNCSGFELKSHTEITSQDSIKISIQVFDCFSGEHVPFSSIFIQTKENNKQETPYFRNKFEYEQQVETGYDGIANFALPKEMEGRVMRISSPEYNEVDVVIPSGKSQLDIKANIQVEYDRVVIPGGTEKYLIKEKSQRHASLIPIHSSSDSLLFLVRVRKFWSKKKFRKRIGKYLNAKGYEINSL